MFRFDEIDPRTTTLSQLKQLVQQQTDVPVEKQFILLRPLQSGESPAANEPQNDSQTLEQYGIRQHGQMVHLWYDAQTVASKQDRELEEERKRREEEFGDGDNLDNLALRLRKKNWTMAEYMKLVESVKVVIKHQKNAVCSRVNLDSTAAHHFQLFLRQIGFSRQRIGYLIGTVQPGKKQEESDSEEDEEPKEEDQNENTEEQDYKEVHAPIIYEPPQVNEGEPVEFCELENESENKTVDEIAHMLGMQRVGWIVTHEGVRDYPLSAKEILRAAELQARYGDHFVTLTLFRNEDGESEFEAFQVSKQCVEMYERGMLRAHETDPELVITTKPVEIQRKRTNEIEGLLLITNVAISGFNSEFKVGFPIENRPVQFYPEYIRSAEAAKNVLLARKNLPFVDRIRDFHLLLWLADYLDLKVSLCVCFCAVQCFVWMWIRD